MKIGKNDLQAFLIAGIEAETGNMTIESDPVEIHTTDEGIMRAAAYAIASDRFAKDVEANPMLLLMVAVLAQDMCNYLIKEQEDRKNAS